MLLLGMSPCRKVYLYTQNWIKVTQMPFLGFKTRVLSSVQNCFSQFSTDVVDMWMGIARFSDTRRRLLRSFWFWPKKKGTWAWSFHDWAEMLKLLRFYPTKKGTAWLFHDCLRSIFVFIKIDWRMFSNCNNSVFVWCWHLLAELKFRAQLIFSVDCWAQV